jgi:hypothetical protein
MDRLDGACRRHHLVALLRQPRRARSNLRGAGHEQLASLRHLRRIVVARGANGGLTFATLNGPTWSAFATILDGSAPIFSPPTCASDSISAICAMLTSTRNIIVNRYVGSASAWQGFLNLGGIGRDVDGLSCVWGPLFTCIVAGTNNMGFSTSCASNSGWQISSWNGWSQIPSTFTGLGWKIACAAPEPQKLHCTFVSFGSVLVGRTVNSSLQWSSGTGIIVDTIGNPACANLDNFKVICLRAAANNQLSSTISP